MAFCWGGAEVRPGVKFWLKPCAKAGFCAYGLLPCGVSTRLPCSDCDGDAWGNCCAAGEKGCGEAVETLCGTPPGRSWLLIMGDGLALADPFCRCEYDVC